LAAGAGISYNFALCREATNTVPRIEAFKASAGVAQLVEQRIRNAKVEGSTPSTGTKQSKACRGYPARRQIETAPKGGNGATPADRDSASAKSRKRIDGMGVDSIGFVLHGATLVTGHARQDNHDQQSECPADQSQQYQAKAHACPLRKHRAGILAPANRPRKGPGPGVPDEGATDVRATK
jgi:hypothetical protein